MSSEPTVSESSNDINMLRKANFNPIVYEGNGSWNYSIYDSKEFADDNAEFMTWANFTNNFQGDSYNPFFDFTSPTFFHPLPCYKQEVFSLPFLFLDDNKI